MAKKKNVREQSQLPKRLLKIFLIVAGVVLFLVGAYVLPGTYGPQRAASGSARQEIKISDEALDELARSERLERIYRAAIDVREPNAEDIQTLDEAIECQVRYIDMVPVQAANRERLIALQTLRQDAAASGIARKSTDAEDEALILEQRKDYVQARAKMREAIDLQERINTEMPLSKHSNANRFARLNRTMQVLIAQPILEESLQSERMAKQAQEKQEWTSALALYRKAAGLQKQLNIGYVQLRFADVARTQRLEAEISSLESVDLYEKINELVARGEKFIKADDLRQAAECFQSAYHTQQELNRSYPQSRFADGTRLEELNTRAQITQSTPLAQEITQAADGVRGLLRARETAKARFALETLQPKVESFKTSFPRSNLIGEDLIFEIRFLYEKRKDIEAIQNKIFEALIALPSGVKMFRTEVPQDLFQEISGTNPSRNRGVNLPVETVNYPEAADFCKRAQLLLGVAVRLPTRQEYREALGALRYADLDAISWHSENATGKTRPVGSKQANALGFSDLLGNVSEWVANDEADAKTAPVMGGNILTLVDQIGDVPEAAVGKTERNRLNGFRFVVDEREAAGE